MGRSSGAGCVKSKPSKQFNCAFENAMKVTTVLFETFTLGKFDLAETVLLEPVPVTLSTTYLPLTPSTKKYHLLVECL